MKDFPKTLFRFDGEDEVLEILDDGDGLRASLLSGEVELPRDQVRLLRDALTKWLGDERATPPWAGDVTALPYGVPLTDLSPAVRPIEGGEIIPRAEPLPPQRTVIAAECVVACVGCGLELPVTSELPARHCGFQYTLSLPSGGTEIATLQVTQL